MASFGSSPYIHSSCNLLLSSGRSSPHLLVCGWCSWIFFFFFFSLYPAFSAASENVTTSASPLKTAATIITSHRILIAVTVSALLFTCFLLMAYFRCLKLKIRKKVRNEEDEECESTKTHVPDGLESQKRACSDDLSKNSVRRFGWEEVEKVTMNFSSVIGQGGYSTVYLGRFSDSSLGALKIHSNSEWLSRVFKQELEILMQVRHENIVKLLGYCDERGGFLVVKQITPFNFFYMVI